MTTFLAVTLAVSLLGLVAVLRRQSGPVRRPAAATVPALAPRARRRPAR